MRTLFEQLYKAQTETELNAIILSNSLFANNDNWYPLGGNDSNFGIVENQQASPVAAIVEKLTNSIDAILMKRCTEENIDPKSLLAPRTMQEAVEQFFENDYKNWNLASFAKEQAKDIQIKADGPKTDTSLIIYDNGEGQHPEDFERTFLSLVRGNKNDIPFVQGKYNMGGTGALVFCGKHRYQLIASKKHDGSGKFGFTLVRRHPLSGGEAQTKKNTWYEYFKINGEIPSFEIDTLDLGIHDRLFKTGTVIKLYSYKLPPGNKLVSRDLNLSLNEYLFEPALPILTVDTKERYPNDRGLERHIFGLKRRMEENSKYIQDYFTIDADDSKIGKMKITSYVFNTKLEGKDVKETKETIKKEFFKNSMYVLFSVNGQVHGFYTSEFATRALKMQLLNDYLLVHVDCTAMNYDFRQELFMGSRDRLKDSDEARELRKVLAEHLKKSKLDDIHKERKNHISMDSGDTNELLKNFTKNLPLNNDLMKLLNQTFKLEDTKQDKKKEKKKEKEKATKEEKKFEPKRFPSFLKFKGNGKTNAVKLPLGGEKTIKLETDVENHYFDRSDEPGKIEVSLLEENENDTTGGTKPGTPKNISEKFDVVTSSPDQGTIKVALHPTKEVQVGDNIPIKISLDSPSETFEEIVWIEISEQQEEKKAKEKQEDKAEQVGLPQFHLVVKEREEGQEKLLTWDDVEAAGKEIGFDTVMVTMSDGEQLSDIYINLDSKVLKNYKAKLAQHTKREYAEKKYITSVYFHTLFLYTITKNRQYQLKTEDNDDITVDEYIEDLFKSSYASFLLNFEIGNIVDTLGV